MRAKISLAVLSLLALALPAHADDTKPVTYSPPPCEFAVTFPGEPYNTQRCEETNPSKCYTQTSYTHVFDMSSTVNFRVICNAIDKKVFESYSPEVMAATLRAMTKRSVVKAFDTSFRKDEHYKQAGLVGEGKSGTLPTIYIAQLWIGEKSAFTVEGEMIGEPHDKADQLFSEVLKSVHYVQPEAVPAEEKKDDKKSEDKKTEDKKE